MRLSSFSTKWSWLLLTTCLHGFGAASAEPASQCSTISDDRARLACYDKAFGKPAAPDRSGAPAASAAAATPDDGGAADARAATPATVSSSPEDDFGLTEAAKRARDPDRAEEQALQSITETVASVRQKPMGELVVTLANGQVWTQLQVEKKARVSPGDTVTIKKASLGSYLLVTSSKVATRVRRVE